MAKRWSYQVGPHGATATVKERCVGGNVYLYAWDRGLNGNRKRSLGFKVRDAEGRLMPEAVERAKAAAAELSNDRVRGEAIQQTTRVRDLFDLFRREKASEMSGQYRRSTLGELDLLERFLGSGFEMEKLGRREWDALRRQRCSGKIDSTGKRVANSSERRPVSPRTVAKTLKVLRQVCRFGASYRREGGGFLLDVDPTRGLKLPKEKNPSRPVASDERYEALLDAAPEVNDLLPSLLILAGETGRRIGAIVALRFSDWLPDQGRFGSLRWRADSDKLGKEWIAPVSPTVKAELERILRERPGVGEGYLFPAPRSSGHVDVPRASRWLKRAEELAGLDHREWGGWHMFRRRWATKRKDMPVKDVAAAGGWKGTHVLQDVYQQADLETMEEVVLGGRELRAV